MIALRIPTERVPLVNGERRVAAASAMDYLLPALVQYDGDDVIVLYADELPPVVDAE